MFFFCQKTGVFFVRPRSYQVILVYLQDLKVRPFYYLLYNKKITTSAEQPLKAGNKSKRKIFYLKSNILRLFRFFFIIKRNDWEKSTFHLSFLFALNPYSSFIRRTDQNDVFSRDDFYLGWNWFFRGHCSIFTFHFFGLCVLVFAE